MKDNNIIQKIRELTCGFKGKDEPSARLTWLKDLVNSYKRYLPPRVVEKIILDPSAKKIEGERRIITVAFADLSGFTALSETMDPEDIANIINDFFTRMLKIVFKYEGSVDKFLGDALMVLFGAPIAHHDDPEREYEYDRSTKLIAELCEQNPRAFEVSIKRDWKRMFRDESLDEGKE